MKNDLKDILIIVPAYNEEKTIQSVIEDLKKHGYNYILVIDDGSNDKTFEIAKNNCVHVAQHLLNRGVGVASATGFEIAKILNPGIVVTFDADGQHNASEIAKLIEPIEVGKADVVIGSRMLGKLEIPLKRFVYNKIANLVTLILYGFTISDTQSGMKAFNRRAYNAIIIETAKMEFCSEIVHKIKKNNLSFKEVKIKSNYTEYSLSKGQNFIIGIKTFFRLVLNRMLSK